MRSALATLSRERAFGLALVSSVIVGAFGERLLDVDLDWWELALFAWLFATILVSAFAVVRHAESLAHRYGEPYGTCRARASGWGSGATGRRGGITRSCSFSPTGP